MTSLGALIQRMVKMTEEQDFEADLVELMNSYSNLLQSIKTDPLTIALVVQGVTMVESIVLEDRWTITLANQDELWKRLTKSIKQLYGKRKSTLDISPLSLQRQFEKITPLVRDVASITEEENLNFRLFHGKNLMVMMGKDTRPNLGGNFGPAEIRFPIISKFLKPFV